MSDGYLFVIKFERQRNNELVGSEVSIMFLSDVLLLCVNYWLKK